MEEKLKEIIKSLNGRVEVKINDNGASTKIGGNMGSIAMIVSIIEDNILESGKISYSEWGELKSNSKILLAMLKEAGVVKYEK